MVTWAKRIIHNIMAAVARVLFIFLVLSIGFDSVSRLYYSYMPIETWMDFQTVHVTMIDGEAVGIIKRKPTTQSISVFHRTLLIRYPYERRGCTNSTVTIIDDPKTDQVMVPLSRMLSDTCPEVIGQSDVDAVLQVSYIFEFPYGVKRLSVRYSNPFNLAYRSGKYVVGAPQHQKN